MASSAYPTSSIALVEDEEEEEEEEEDKEEEDEEEATFYLNFQIKVHRYKTTVKKIW